MLGSACSRKGGGWRREEGGGREPWPGSREFETDGSSGFGVSAVGKEE